MSRDRLDGQYEDARGRVLRVLAPPGYGKSTQVARWVGADDRHVGWVDLERVDNDPVVLAAALRSALGIRRAPATSNARAKGQGAVDLLVAQLRGAVADAARPFVLVLDDVHNLESEDSLAVIDAVIGLLSSTSTLVLCGRTHADHGTIARRRLAPGVVDVSSSELSLDATETDELLRSIGVELEIDGLTQVCDRFEGWVAGVRLAGLALKGEGAHSWLSPDHVGDTSFVVDYLRSEWVGQLSDDDRRFLGEAACLQRFTGEMCDEVLERKGSHAQLRRMHHEQLLVLPLDQRDEWFRMHPLLTRWLSADLEQTDQERWRDIHLRASVWWRERHDIDLAFEHLLVADDLTRAESLVSDFGFDLLSKGLYSTVQRWLAALPGDLVQHSPGLCAVHALDEVQRGRGAQALRWYEQLERIIATAPASTDANYATRDRARADVLRITLAHEDARDLLPVARAVVPTLDADAWCSLALAAQGGLRFLAGEDEPTESIEQAAFVAENNDLVVHQANCTAAIAILADLRGERDRASDAAARATDLLSRCPGELPSTTAMVDAGHALVVARAGRRDEAAKLVEGGRTKLGAYSDVAPWFNALCGLGLARAAVLIDDRATSRALVRDLEHALRHEAPGNGAAPYVEELRHQIEAARQLPSDPGSALTEAELKVLRFLPTNLTLSDIATRLFVSRNTVKSHVAAIYRKLNATSRSDAVDLARRTGLLEEDSSEHE